MAMPIVTDGFTPSRGDLIFVNTGEQSFTGRICDTAKGKLRLELPPSSFNVVEQSGPVAVSFAPCKTNLLLCTKALNIANGFPQPVLFPTRRSVANVRTKSPRVDTMARRLSYTTSLNPEQEQAVRNIVEGRSIPHPYIVYGPPGTGKTVTIVEAVKQTLKYLPHMKILICTPTNEAADLMVERLADHFVSDKSNLLRVMAFGRDKESVRKEVLAFAQPYDEDEKGFKKVSPSMLRRSRVVVSTLMSAARLKACDFGMIIVDEAAQATEPDVLAGIVKFFDHDTQLVLAGDPKQLGPLVLSIAAKDHGLDMSLLERLLCRDGYSRDVAQFPTTHGYDPLLVTKLVENYRSHPKILTVPSQSFYDDELTPKGDKSVTNSLLGWKHLPNPSVPLLFHGVDGENLREGTCLSFFNIDEAAVVLDYVRLLLRDKNLKIKQSEIGIITPYKKQVMKLEQLMHLNGYKELKIGTVETFQGQERRVIILSTVRSSSDFIPTSAEPKLGFISCPKRFNVAITRAQALLIVVGSPAVLHSDMTWNKLLEHCAANAAIVGAPVPRKYADSAIESLNATIFNIVASLPQDSKK